MFEFKLENEQGRIVDINDDINYCITGVTGLTPPSASIYTAKSPNRKGSRYNGSTLDERTMIISVKLLKDVEASRNALYDWIDSERYCKIRYRNDLKNVYCEGWVHECDADIFSDNEIVNFAVTCPNPYWRDLQSIAIDITAVLKQFTFPFAIDAAGIPISTLRDSNHTNIFNAGVETGILIRVVCRGEIKNFTMYNANDATERFTIHTTLFDGWTVEINTDTSPKTCVAYPADLSRSINLLKYTKNPTWFKLRRGNNLFGYTAESGLSYADVTIDFTNKYLGV